MTSGLLLPAFYSDWGDADITEAYIDRIGFTPVPGQKYLLSFWWMDTETGFTGESMAVSTICGELSNVNKELYGSPTDELLGCGLGRKLSFQGYEIGAFRESYSGDGFR